MNGYVDTVVSLNRDVHGAACFPNGSLLDRAAVPLTKGSVGRVEYQYDKNLLVRFGPTLISFGPYEQQWLDVVVTTATTVATHAPAAAERLCGAECEKRWNVREVEHGKTITTLRGRILDLEASLQKMERSKAAREEEAQRYFKAKQAAEDRLDIAKGDLARARRR